MTRRFSPSAGFTLVEMIMVIVITGIVAGMVAVFIRAPVQGYVDSVRRAELTDQADVALRRIARDVRLALPNSLREVEADRSFEFIMTKSGGRYRDPADGSTGGNFLRFTADTNPDCTPSPNNRCFDALGKTSNAATDTDYIAINDYLVVYNLGAGYAPADAYRLTPCTAPGCNIAQVSSVTCPGSPTPCRIQMTSNPFAAQTPPLPSPSSRFQVVDQNELVVRYVCDGQTLTRLSGCTLAPSPDCSAAPSALLAGSATAEPKASCEIDYQANATGRNGLLYVRLTLRDTPSDESITLFQQIHVDNSP